MLPPHHLTLTHLRAAACQTPPMVPSAAAALLRGIRSAWVARALTEKFLSRWRYASPSSAGHHPYCPSSSSRSGRVARGCRASLHLRICPRASTHMPIPALAAISAVRAAQRLLSASGCVELSHGARAMNSAQLNTSNPAIRRILSEIKKLVCCRARLPLRLIACCAHGNRTDACLRG